MALIQTIGFATVVLPASTAFVQLPNLPCEEITIGTTTNAIAIAGASSPGAAVLTIPSNGASFPGIVIPTAGNANNLWIANSTATTGNTVGFMWATNRVIGPNG